MRELAWDGCVNTRDLGGLPGAGGRATRFGRVVRSDCVRRLSDHGWRALAEHGVRRVVDLRTAAELGDDPPCEVPVEVVHVSLLGDWDERENARHDAKRDEVDSAEPYLLWAYEEFLERFPDRFAAAVQAVADAPEGAVVVHCLAGKDRTGLVTALLLRLAGVSIADVAADYAISEARLEPFHQAWVDEAADAAEARRRELMRWSPASAMASVLAALERRCGSVEAYLRSGGLEPDAPSRVRDRLLAA